MVGNAAPSGHLLRDRVDLAPIRRFLSGAMLPILGDDPRSVDGRKVFSAAPLKANGTQTGFLYVVLLGEAHDVFDAKDATGMALKIALWCIGLVALLCLLAGLLAFAWITPAIAPARPTRLVDSTSMVPPTSGQHRAHL